MNLTPADLASLLARAPASQALGRGDVGIVAAFFGVCRALEPNLVWAQDTERIDWLENTAKVDYTLQAWTHDPHFRGEVMPKVLSRLVEVANAAWRGPALGPVRPFPFIRDRALRRIAERDYATLLSARRHDEIKTVLVFAGSVIECMLIDILEHDAVKTAAAAAAVKSKRAGVKRWSNFNASAMDNWNFFQLIAVCGPDGLQVLTETTEKTADVLRDLRNFVHPKVEREETGQRPLSAAEATIAEGLAQRVIDEVASHSLTGTTVVLNSI